MKITTKLSQRLISLLICMAMLVATLPLGIFALSDEAISSARIAAPSRVVDNHTLDQWKNFFGIQEGDASLTTEYAGGVWTDKSVFSPTNLPEQLTNAKYNGNGISIRDKGDNFLVALSAIASNKQIKGFSTIPTDTVLILDFSSSMRSADDNGGSAVDELVEATNKAITDLLALNSNNRVSVVIYAGNVAKNFGVDSDGITQVIMPLDRYTTATAGTYLVSKNVGSNPHRAVEIASNVKNSEKKVMPANRFETSTSTYMQDGIYEAMKVLLNADPVVSEGVQKGTTRMPIMVLMTDGEPTLGTNDYNGNDNRTDLGLAYLNNYTGTTGSNTFRDTIAFVTSLTAAFAKKTIESHYGRSALMYTLPYGDSVLQRGEALSVLNPAEASDVQNGFWDSFLKGDRITVFRKSGKNGYEYIYASNSTVESERLTAEDRYYVDKYFPAKNDDEMLNAFESIVEEIEIQSKYYPTYVESDHDHDGYLTFVDKIGAYMEVSDMKGIVVGDRFFSGEAIASYYDDDAFVAEMVRSVKERLGIENDSIARALIQNAHAHNQLYYKDSANYENYIGWFSDENGEYVDFWHKGMTPDQYEAAKKKGATHVIRSYLFLGDTDVVPGVSNTDMMYMSVRIATAIDAAQTIVTWRIPASLVPTITYLVDVEVDADGNITKILDVELEQGTATSPIRLVYEVEMRGDITDWNVKDVVDADYVSENGYTFYTNKWTSDANDTTLNTYSHFEPSVQNERYYYTQDTVVMVKNGESYSEYSGGKPSGTGYYREYEVFEKLDDGSCRIHYHYEAISAEALSLAEQDGNKWFIPKDTVHRYYDYEIAEKEANITQTMGYSDHPFVVKNGETYYTYSTQGNNGRITITPATGIKLSKKLADGYTSNEDFTFVISGDISEAVVIRLNSSGYEASRTPIDASGEVTLKAGETVYVIGLAEGRYSVSEQIPAGADYRVSSVSVNGQSISEKTAAVSVTNENVASVDFTNDKLGYGSLIISKDVNYPQGFAPTASHDAKEFTINVTFEGDITGITAPTGAVANGNTYTIVLKDGETAGFYSIPQDVTYKVEETSIPNGYEHFETRYSNNQQTIVPNVTDQVHVVNNYNLAPVSANITLNGTKTVEGQWPNGAEFTIKLLESDHTSETVIDTGLSAVVGADSASYEIDMSSIKFDFVGTYHFHVVEDIPENRIPDMAYDRTFGVFTVTVTDTDADGALEIASVEVYQDTVLGGDSTNGYTITKNFTNVVTTDIVYIDVTKQVVDASDSTVTYNEHLADITFGLFDSMNSATPAYYVVTDENGKAAFAVPVSKDKLGEGKTYYLREMAPDLANRVIGMHYDESWIGAFNITWDDAENVAITEYAPIENGSVGSYSEYDRNDVEIIHTNTFESPDEFAPEIILSGNKTLNGGNDLGGREFSFSLYQTTAAFVIQGDAIQTVTNNGNAITFAGIKLDKVGLHYFSVKENSTNLGGVTIDENHYHITVLVEKFVDTDGTTRLRVAEGYPIIHAYGSNDSVAADQLNFNNIYTLSGETSVTIDGTKILEGRPLLNGEFRFSLVQVADANGTEMNNPFTSVTENSIAANGTAGFSFAPITYNQVGEYYYRISEIKGAENNGITYSDDSYIVKVVVEDNGEGGFKSSWSVVDDREISFVNVYTPADVEISLNGGKELNGKLLGDGQFSFVLEETQRDFETPVNGGELREVTNNAQGIINFGAFKYDSVGTYYYTVREVIPNNPLKGVIYDTTEYRVTVVVTDNHNGSLEATYSLEMVHVNGETVQVPASSMVFYNEYTITGTVSVEISGEKTLEGMELSDGMFGFELYETDSEYAIEGVVPEIKENVNGKYSFIRDFLPEDAGKTFYYLVKETNAGLTIDGITYSSAEYRIQIDIIDNGEGGIEAVVTAENTEIINDENAIRIIGVNFTNTYNTTNVNVNLNGDKELSGKLLGDGQFNFILEETDSDFETIIENGENRNVANDADGAIDFGEFNYTTPGTYYYIIREEIGAEKGIVYDETEYHVTVVVTDMLDGTLETSVTVEKITKEGDATQVVQDEIIFRNAYTVTGNATVEINGEKTLEGMELSDGMFSFELYATDSEYTIEGITPEIKENVNGKYSFLLEFLPEDAGKTFYYVVKETNAGLTIDGITYSTAEYKIKIDVLDNGEGGINTVVTVDGAEAAQEGNAVVITGINFTNTYTPPVPVIPDTGDNANMARMIMLMCASVIGLVLITKDKRFIKAHN